jgi:hypothetical protein
MDARIPEYTVGIHTGHTFAMHVILPSGAGLRMAAVIWIAADNMPQDTSVCWI